MRRRGRTAAGAAPALQLLAIVVCLTLGSQARVLGGLVVNQNMLDSEELPYLASGDSLVEGEYRLEMRQDCDLSLYKFEGSDLMSPKFTIESLVWSSRTEGAGWDCFLVMQEDGDLVISTANGHTVWSSSSGPWRSLPGSRYYAILQKNGNFAVKLKSGWSIWESGTSQP